MNPNFRFLSPAEFNVLNHQELLNYFFEEMTFLIELDMARIDSYNIQNPSIENTHNFLLEPAVDENLEEQEDDDFDEDAMPPASACNVQPRKRKRDDDFDPSSGGCRIIKTFSCSARSMIMG